MICTGETRRYIYLVCKNDYVCIFLCVLGDVLDANVGVTLRSRSYTR